MLLWMCFSLTCLLFLFSWWRLHASDSLLSPFWWAHPHPEAHLTYEKILALLKKILPDLPRCLSPTPKSFPILWAGTGQGFVKQILFYSLHTCFFISGKCACEQRMDSELVVLFLALFQSLWKIWDRITKSSKRGFPPRPDVALDSFSASHSNQGS